MRCMPPSQARQRPILVNPGFESPRTPGLCIFSEGRARLASRPKASITQCSPVILSKIWRLNCLARHSRLFPYFACTVASLSRPGSRDSWAMAFEAGHFGVPRHPSPSACTAFQEAKKSTPEIIAESC
ncbi:hypothetical protein LIA77_07571 [Sarocladium implicatum]|nr:hypothetical protein LIA77_07571 [Sarocladium implicatum]